ncbi:MAG: YraN family protein [Anaerolineae bacterium]
MPDPRHTLGRRGEALAAEHLLRNGLTIIDRNWRCPLGELDIIARDGDEWVFVEVRTRRARTTNTALESMTGAKQSRLIAAIHAYFEARGYDLEDVIWRVDLVVIALSAGGARIEVIRDALQW